MTAAELEKHHLTRESAHEIWIEHGRPSGRDVEFWVATEREPAGEDMQASTLCQPARLDPCWQASSSAEVLDSSRATICLARSDRRADLIRQYLPSLPGPNGFHPAIIRAHSNAVSSSITLGN
jgi:hypothetical protein